MHTFIPTLTFENFLTMGYGTPTYEEKPEFYEMETEPEEESLEFNIIFQHELDKLNNRKHRSRMSRDNRTRNLNRTFPTPGSARFAKKMCHRYNRRKDVGNGNYYKNEYSKSSTWYAVD